MFFFHRLSIVLALLVSTTALGASEPDTRPVQMPDYAALRQQLASPEFSQRQAAEKVLDGIPVTELGTLRSLAQFESDPEVKARLENRIDALEVFVLTHPKGLSLHLKNAGLGQVADELQKQLGSEVEVAVTNLLPPATFSLDVDDVSFWQAFAELNRQRFLTIPPLTSSTTAAGTKVQLRLGTAAGAGAPAYRIVDNFLVTPNIAASGANGNWSLRFTINPDPRVRITQHSPYLRVTKLTDQNNTSLIASITSTTPGMTTLARPVPSCTSSINFSPTPDLTAIKDLRATLDLAILEKETTLSVDLSKPNIAPLETARGTITVTNNGNGITVSTVPPFNPAPGLPPPAVRYMTIRVFDQEGKAISNTLTSGTTLSLTIRIADPNAIPTKVELTWPESSRKFSLPIELHDIAVPQAVVNPFGAPAHGAVAPDASGIQRL